MGFQLRPCGDSVPSDQGGSGMREGSARAERAGAAEPEKHALSRVPLAQIPVRRVASPVAVGGEARPPAPTSAPLPSLRGRPLGEILVARGKITPAALEALLE